MFGVTAICIAIISLHAEVIAKWIGWVTLIFGITSMLSYFSYKKIVNRQDCFFKFSLVRFNAKQCKIALYKDVDIFFTQSANCSTAKLSTH